MAEPIVGIATAAGEGGIAIVRMSGEGVVELFQQVFVPNRQKPPFESHKLMYGRVMDGDTVLDEAMGVVMYAPHTYTREDVCELHTHGGAAAAGLTVKLLLRLGARVAQAGEFTRRAFMNGRLDLSQAEAVMGIISAQSAAALKASQRQLQGGQSRFIKDCQQELTGLLAGLEAHIDYPDEIDEDEALSGLAHGLSLLIDTLSSAIDRRGSRILREGLRVALCGRPNAGKSTLFNALLGEERAIVTAVPGTTRDVLEGCFSLDGVNVFLCDTAGLRQSDDLVERIGVERAEQTLRQADVALLLIDATKAPDPADLALMQREMPCPRAVLLNKQDAGAAFTPADALALGIKEPVYSVAAQTGEGLSQVYAFLRQYLNLPKQLVLTQERHMELAGDALTRLRQAQSGLTGGAPLDLAAIDLHEALYLLGRITGDSVDEQLLDDIFSRFCVGK
ncbi:MAG: tRNA uridine-5-carboxymethylaminomethyl(34) synthesis GTPase MnmE [Eubacteriales bacterium]|nr:tRNA uridine-5-carboxymethylaminomethyl(34) synthesis GTPase MnmE [Eubacteriales bacterium]